MKLMEAKRHVEKLANVPFEKYLSPFQYENIVVNKGKTGQLLEVTIGLPLSNSTLDFEDGELKTNKCDHLGNPLETMCITQIASMIDEILERKPFRKTRLFNKIQNILYVPISKDGDSSKWRYLSPIQVDLSQSLYNDLVAQLEKDYYTISDKMNAQLSVLSTATLHTAGGQFIQVRTKDSKPYTPIYSQKYGRYISDKNRAFYFKREFMKYIVQLNKNE